jgi:hypothetical protein
VGASLKGDYMNAGQFLNIEVVPGLGRHVLSGKASQRRRASCGKDLGLWRSHRRQGSYWSFPAFAGSVNRGIGGPCRWE